MADDPDKPEQRPAKKAPAKKAPAKKPPAGKAPAKKAPAKKSPSKQAPAKKPPTEPAPPQAALNAAAEVPALEPAPPHAALTAGPSPAQQAAANAKESVRQAAGAPAPGPMPERRDSGIRKPLTIGLTALSFIALLLRRLRRGGR